MRRSDVESKFAQAVTLLICAVGISAFTPASAQPLDNTPVAMPAAEPAIAGAVAEAPPERQGTPSELLRRDVNGFVSDLNLTREVYFGFPDILRYVKAARAGFYNGYDWITWWPNIRGDKLRLDTLTIDKISDEQASIRLTYSLVRGEYASKHEESFDLVWAKATDPTGNGKYWQFVPVKPDMRTFSSKPLGWGIYQLAQVPDSGAAFCNARSMSQQKQLALAALQFTQDWNNIFAFDTEFAEDALRPYMRDNSLWLVAHTGQHFKFNSRLSGVSAGALEDPANTVLFYDGANEQPVFRYDNLSPICFADGHVKLVDAESAKKLRWRP